jgi:hypothetical protein
MQGFAEHRSAPPERQSEAEAPGEEGNGLQRSSQTHSHPSPPLEGEGATVLCSTVLGCLVVGSTAATAGKMHRILTRGNRR